jgi:hypothetical protein
MSITVMKQALEALGWTDEWRPQGLKERAITALRTAIAEAEKQEPVARISDDPIYIASDGGFYPMPRQRKPLEGEEP